MIAAIILGVGVVVELAAILRAPMSYQDQSGFHIGVPASEDEDGLPSGNPS